MPLVHHFLQQSAARTPDKIALITGNQRYTYGQLDAMSNRMANALRERGVQRGDRVVLFLPNSVELVAGVFAALKAGGVFVVVNATTKQDKLTYLIDNSRATAIVAQSRRARMTLDLLAKASSLQFAILTGDASAATGQDHENILSFDQIQKDCPPSQPPRVNDTSDLACLIYTSGSTGEPKGVMSAHSNIVFAASSIISYLRNREDDIVINVLPLSFDYGLYQLLMTFSFGGTLVLERGFAYPAQILKKIEKERVTGFPGVPTLFAILLQMDLEPYDLSSLRYITNTAAALPPSHIQQIRQKFPGVTLYSMYGLTETKRTLYLPPEQLDSRPGSVGIAIPGTEVWIEDDEGNRLGPNDVGELVIRGPHVMQGYWENPEATARRYRTTLNGERICYSGDLFRMDEEGYMYFVGRKDDIIKSRGEKVAPKEIENVLYALPGVTEAAVIGVPDPVLGQGIKAIIVNNGQPHLSERDVLLHCRQNLEDFMVPQIVEFHERLPKTSSGKIMKTGLS